MDLAPNELVFEDSEASESQDTELEKQSEVGP